MLIVVMNRLRYSNVLIFSLFLILV